MPSTTLSDQALRARDFQRAKTAAICDVREPWEHGMVMRATRYPTYYEYNLLRVYDDPGMSVAQLTATADDALADYAHRRIDFELAEVAEPLRGEFHAAGYRSTRLLWMLHDGRSAAPPEQAIAVEVEEADYDAAAPLREAWHREDHEEADPDAYHAAAREVAMARQVRVLLALRDGEPIGFAQLECVGEHQEVSSVYVEPSHRGAGLGTAITAAAIAAASPEGDLWIVADDEDRPKELYARLGFRGVYKATELTRWP
ncbi:MAG TPA: GNAT family N-acetyltransferase [Solirubrobacteraceae bacterium]